MVKKNNKFKIRIHKKDKKVVKSRKRDIEIKITLSFYFIILYSLDSYFFIKKYEKIKSLRWLFLPYLKIH